MQQQKRILFITSTRLGDAVLTTGILNALLTRHPDALFTIACGKPPADLFRPFPQLERLIIIEKKPYSRHWWDLWRAVVGIKWHTVVDLRSSTIAYMLHAKHRFVFKVHREEIHKVQQFGALLRLSHPPAPTLWLKEEHRITASTLIPDEPVIALGATANWAGKQWLWERFLGLMLKLTASDGLLPNAKIALFAAPNERDSIIPLIEGIPEAQCIDLIGKVNLPTLAACVERCTLYIGNDSGLMHLAAAIGTPTLGLFGPSKTSLYAPWGTHTAFVRTPESLEELTNFAGYDHKTVGTLMNTLSVEAVAEAAATLYKEYYEQ
jgi:heptosyltransferase-3